MFIFSFLSEIRKYLILVGFKGMIEKDLVICGKKNDKENTWELLFCILPF
jgi:hypothetical protein